VYVHKLYEDLIHLRQQYNYFTTQSTHCHFTLSELYKLIYSLSLASLRGRTLNRVPTSARDKGGKVTAAGWQVA